MPNRVVGLMVRIDAFQALGPGSIPGRLKHSRNGDSNVGIV